MSDIQVRNRYKKEIDILINRLWILQEQEKSYKNLSWDIEKLQNKIKWLKKTEGNLDKQIESKEAVIEDLGVKNKQYKSEWKKIEKEYTKLKKQTDKEREDYLKQKEIYNNHLDKIHQTITKTNLKKEDFHEKMLESQKEYNELVEKIKRDKWDLFDKVMNNEKILQEQLNEIEENNKRKEVLEKEYEELDTEYQKLLENYIIKE